MGMSVVWFREVGSAKELKLVETGVVGVHLWHVYHAKFSSDGRRPKHTEGERRCEGHSPVAKNAL